MGQKVSNVWPINYVDNETVIHADNLNEIQGKIDTINTTLSGKKFVTSVNAVGAVTPLTSIGIDSNNYKISNVSVSATGTATDEISYITVDGVEKKIAGGGSGGSDPVVENAKTTGGIGWTTQETQTVTITWDGDTTDKTSVMNMFYLIDNRTFTQNDLLNTTGKYTLSGVETPVTITSSMFQVMSEDLLLLTLYDGEEPAYAVFAYNDNVSVEGLTFPTKGTYLSKMGSEPPFVSYLSASIQIETIHKLNEKYYNSTPEWDDGYSISYVTDSSNSVVQPNGLTTLDGTSWNFKDQFFTEEQLEELAAKAEEMEFNEDLLIIANVKVCKGSEVLYDFVVDLEKNQFQFLLYSQRLMNNNLLKNSNDIEDELGFTPTIMFYDGLTEEATVLAGLNSAAATMYSQYVGTTLEPGIYLFNEEAEQPSGYFIWLGSYDEISFDLSATNISYEGMSVDDIYGVNHAFPCYFFETYLKPAGVSVQLLPDGYFKEYGVECLPTFVPNTIFMGWYDNQEKTGDIVMSIPKNSTGDKTMYINDDNYNVLSMTEEEAQSAGYVWGVEV